MRKYAAGLSIVLTLISISPLFFNAIDEWLVQIFIVSFLTSLILGLYAEKSIWRKLALWFLSLVFLVLVLFFVVTTLLWNKP
ncbi:hypothetical protein CEQ21_00180 [Niallia circulans]|uniref:Uncharacterized protein n=1 Tax=Niallia circulans TaxID=1397 RepID=A0A553SR15_NIACI|nr:hypothetical protein [Niallia circulans]TRZ39435.1 hypothetical protein CEQ21_00180 [Niallia circulans]